MKILKYIRNLLNKDSNKASMDFAIAHGLQVGKNFEYHDGYSINKRNAKEVANQWNTLEGGLTLL